MTRAIVPTFKEEKELISRGITMIAGVDEAGCGCWAGPVYAAAVILPIDSRIGLVRDSKTLSRSQRDHVESTIKESCFAWAVGSASAKEIDALNIRRAGALAMMRAIEALSVKPEFVLIDAFRIPDLTIPSKSIIRGDRIVKSIAAASILAKNARDRHLEELDKQFPAYGFANHKGYGTKQHQEALKRLGPSSVHRMSYEPCKNAQQKTVVIARSPQTTK